MDYGSVWIYDSIRRVYGASIMNVEKMRRHMARNTPDSVWMDFNRDDFIHFGYIPGYEAWAQHWRSMMKIKYAGEPVIMNVFQSENFDTNTIRIQLAVGNR